MAMRQPTAPAAPAGVMVRAGAFAVDYVVIGAYLIVLVITGVSANRLEPELLSTVFGTPLSGQLTAFAVVTLPVTLYFAVQEASAAQATHGKRHMGLKVITVDGRRLSFLRSLVRTLLKFVPWELSHTCIWQIALADDPTNPVYMLGFTLVWLLIGANLLSAARRDDRQAIYDRLTGTMVVRDKTSVASESLVTSR